MPTTKRSRVVQAPVEDVWKLVSDPYSQPRWWPRVGRVENVDDRGFTQVFRTQKGSAVRADYLWDEVRSPERITWDQDIDGTPFERMLEAARWELDLAPEGDGATRITLSVKQRLRGFARFGGTMFRGANKRLLDEALDGVERCIGG